MANWSYNGTILPAFPTDWGEYSDSYTYWLILWGESRQSWFALASSKAFGIDTKSNGRFRLDDVGYHGEYVIAKDGTEWIYLGSKYEFDTGELELGGSTGFQVIWANHDLINQTDGSVYLDADVAVSPGSVITKLTTNVTQLRLYRGECFQLAAKVEGTEIFSDRVDYTLSKNDAYGGTTISRKGLLSVGETEYSPAFTVTVSSRQDPSVKETITVTVADYLSKLSMKVVTDLCDYNGAVLPAFPTDWGEYSDSYPYRAILWSEKLQRWYALASSDAFTVEKEGGTLWFHTGYRHGEYYLPAGDTAWIYIGNNYTQHAPLPTMGEFGYRTVWANHDVMNLTDETVYFPQSESVELCSTTDTLDGTAYQIIGSTIWLDGSCVYLSEPGMVYTVKFWVYREWAGLNTALPPTWTSEVFAGPSWKARVSFSDLIPFTPYGIYAVICVNGVATGHYWQGTFTTRQADAAMGLAVEAERVRDNGFTVSVTRWGLEEATEYIAEISVYDPDTGMAVFDGELSFYGSGTEGCVVTGLEPDTRYAVSVAVYPASTGEVTVRGEYFFTTAPEQTGWNIYTGVSGRARRVRAVYVGVNGRARAVKGVYVGVNGRAQPL